MDKPTIGVGVGGAAVVGVAFGLARYAYGLTLPDVRSEFGLSEPLLGLIASGTFAGYLVALVSVPLGVATGTAGTDDGGRAVRGRGRRHRGARPLGMDPGSGSSAGW